MKDRRVCNTMTEGKAREYFVGCLEKDNDNAATVFWFWRVALILCLFCSLFFMLFLFFSFFLFFSSNDFKMKVKNETIKD